MELLDVIMTSPETVPVSQVPQTVVKTEKLTSSLEKSNYSEILCMGTLKESTIEINDSEDENQEPRDSFQVQEPEDNPFLKEINQGTQSQSNEANTDFREFVTVSVKHAFEDRQQLEEINTDTQHISKKRRASSTSGKPGPKFTKRPKSNKKAENHEQEEYVDGSELDGNGNRSNSLDVLNDDFSVFLSSQLIEQEEIYTNVDKEKPQFTLIKPVEENFHEHPLESTCFIVQLLSVFFEKNVKFEIFVSLPQFNAFNTVIAGETIRTVLNISEKQFNSILDLLNLLERYEFSIEPSRRSRSFSGDVHIINQLDLFFTSQIRFKSFLIKVKEGNHTFFDGTLFSNSNDLTSAIPQDISRAMRSS